MKKTDWIETKYKKPKHNQYVLCWHDDSYYIGQYYSDEDVFHIQYSVDKESEMYRPIKGLTCPSYWLPLIAPPKKRLIKT